MQVQPKDILETVLEYLDLLANDRVNAEADVRALTLVLDKLAFAYHFADGVASGTPYPDELRAKTAKWRQLAAHRFPQFGSYNLARPVTEQRAEAEVVVGDAIDDLADIAADLYEVAWRWKNSGADDALWHFRHIYDFHWGEHLRALQMYLHAFKSRL